MREGHSGHTTMGTSILQQSVGAYWPQTNLRLKAKGGIFGARAHVTGLKPHTSQQEPGLSPHTAGCPASLAVGHPRNKDSFRMSTGAPTQSRAGNKKPFVSVCPGWDWGWPLLPATPWPRGSQALPPVLGLEGGSHGFLQKSAWRTRRCAFSRTQIVGAAGS